MSGVVQFGVSNNKGFSFSNVMMDPQHHTLMTIASDKKIFSPTLQANLPEAVRGLLDDRSRRAATTWELMGLAHQLVFFCGPHLGREGGSKKMLHYQP